MGKRVSRELDMKLARISGELENIINCKSCCEFECVFPDVGAGEGCPISKFLDRVEEVVEGE